ncbi:hypothetical protein H0E87_023798 [Populus deltoides]|uniref:Uncharacterized protein n=1 Tax=Populus deltoides TaxID=3696 RepID=A0A8T2X2W6_POPDE|nr:hypothetical protein H0E87_023798 [Populus deltoides]
MTADDSAVRVEAAVLDQGRSGLFNGGRVCGGLERRGTICISGRRLWGFPGDGDEGSVEDGVMCEKLSDPNCIGSAWRIWKVENVVGKKGKELVCKHGGGVSKLVTVASLLTFLD